jgi:hypothetical protein
MSPPPHTRRSSSDMAFHAARTIFGSIDVADHSDTITFTEVKAAPLPKPKRKAVPIQKFFRASSYSCSLAEGGELSPRGGSGRRQVGGSGAGGRVGGGSHWHKAFGFGPSWESELAVATAGGSRSRCPGGESAMDSAGSISGDAKLWWSASLGAVCGIKR